MNAIVDATDEGPAPMRLRMTVPGFAGGGAGRNPQATLNAYKLRAAMADADAEFDMITNQWRLRDAWQPVENMDRLSAYRYRRRAAGLGTP